jgi:hypothetical protein
MQFSTLLLAIPVAFVAAAPATDNMSRQVASGCYALFVLLYNPDYSLQVAEADFKIL